MAVSAFGLLCVGLFVMLLMGAGIAALVVVIKLISGPTEPRPASSVAGVKAFLGMSALGFVGLVLLGGLFFTSVRSHRASATIEHAPPMPPVQFPQEAEQVMQRARQEAEAAMQRGRQEAEAAMRRAMAQVPAPLAARPPQVASIRPVDPVSAVEAVAAAHMSALPEPPTADRTTVEPTSPAGPPAWIKSVPQTNGEIQTLVISSKQYATQAEAENDASGQVMALLREDLRKYTSQTWVQPRDVIGTPLSEVVGLAVREQYVETVNRDFGSFFAPMYRVWYRVELSPQVREPVLVRWRAALTESRMLAAGGGFLALLCVPLAVVTYGRCNRWTHGKARTPLAIGMTAVVLAAWVIGAKLIAVFVLLA
ncbi:MAG TPA: hypothetical protein VM165_07170 [Planctomycetaceae bacterium]|nr:hypothetical protein [Planctomycetaceae bacterium]